MQSRVRISIDTNHHLSLVYITQSLNVGVSQKDVTARLAADTVHGKNNPVTLALRLSFVLLLKVALVNLENPLHFLALAPCRKQERVLLAIDRKHMG